MLSLYRQLDPKQYPLFLTAMLRTNSFLFKLLPQRIVIIVEISWSKKKGIGIINLKVYKFSRKGKIEKSKLPSKKQKKHCPFYVFALLISMPHFKIINFYRIGPKIKLFAKPYKILKC